MYTGSLVRLRRVEPERDVLDRHRWMNDPEVLRFLGMRPARLSVAEVRKYLETTAASASDTVEFAVETLEGVHIGGCTLRGFNHVARSAEYGVAIGEAEYRGRGYGTDVTRLIVQIGFEQFNLNRIWLTVSAGNTAGMRAYEKAGFVKEGLLRSHGFANGAYYDSYLMAVLREDYERRKELPGR